MTERALWPEGVAQLAADDRFGGWVERIGPVTTSVVSGLDPFAYLVRAVVFQQLAGAAARTIHGRVEEVLGGCVTPEAVGAADPTALRGAGLSASKLRAIVDLAEKVRSGEVCLDEAELDALDDEAVVSRLTKVWGIGRWTAQMFLIFRLGRPDVWPADDLGVRSGWARIHGCDRPPSAELQKSADHLAPWRSAAAWYCWRALEVADPPGARPA